MNKRIFTIALTFLWAISLMGATMIDGIYYNLNSDGTAEVTSGSDKYQGDIVIPSTVKHTATGIECSVTSIGNTAFLGCSSLKSITIPNSVTSIGERAFSDCNSLKSVTIGNSVTSIGEEAFSGCSGLTSVTIPNSVTSIGKRAFLGCSSLKSISVSNPFTKVDITVFWDTPWYLEQPIGMIYLGEIAYWYKGDNNSIKDMKPSTVKSITLKEGTKAIADLAFVGCPDIESITIPKTVIKIGCAAFAECANLKTITLPNTITAVGNDTFNKCSGLASVTIPNSVTSIGERAFSGCSGLTSITIPSSVTSIGSSAFSGCSGLSSVTIPNSVTSIGKRAFSGCSGLTSITIPNSVTSIGEEAFSGCSGLTSITIPNSVTSIGVGAFDDTYWYNKQPNGVVYIGNMAYCYKGDKSTITSVVIKDGIKYIGDYAFYDCSNLKSIKIPNSVTSIGNRAFYGCSSLTSITIPSSVTSIGVGAFSGCSGLTSISIPNSVTSIGGGAFYGCSGLTSITIPNSVTSIGEKAFYGCSGLTSITIPNSVTSIGDDAFYRCSSLTSITIPNSVTSIGYSAFYGCSSLTSISIPNSVTSIGGGAFKHCSSLTSIIIPSSVTSIGRSTFAGCSSLTSISIPNSVTSIEEWAFYGCTALDSIKLPSSITHIEESAFDKNVVLMVRRKDIARFQQMESLAGIKIVPYFEPPVIADIQVTNVNYLGYTVVCKVEGDTSIARVQFPTWTTYKGQDDLLKDWSKHTRASGKVEGDEYSFQVNIKDHNGESGEYVTHIYAFDKLGNKRGCAVPAVIVPKPKCEIADIQITDMSCLGYSVSCNINCEANITSAELTVTKNDRSYQKKLQIPFTTKASTNLFTCRVNTADFLDHTGKYQGKIVVKDEYGNQTEVNIPDVDVPHFIRIADVQILNLNNKGYTISCTIDSHYKVAQVQFAEWTENNGTDDAPADWKEKKSQAGKADGNVYTFDVKKMKHHNECGKYKNKVYISDEKGHSICLDLPDAEVPCKK